MRGLRAGWLILTPAVALAVGMVPAIPAAGQVFGQRMMRAGGVGFPVNTTDSRGNQWMIYQGGWLRQMSNTPQGNYQLYSQGAMLMLNGAQINMNNNQVQVDPKTGEAVLENLAGNNGLTATRHILVNKEEGYVRYIDVIKNTQNRDQDVTIMIQSNFNYGINNAQMVEDPKQKGQNLAWVAQVPIGVPQTLMEVFGGKGAKTLPSINYPQGNNYVQATLQTKIPAGKEVALMHLHSVMPSEQAATKFVQDLKESKLMATIPAPLRKLIVNFKGGDQFIGDYELLRGDLFDVVELHGGDQIKGTLQEPAYKLNTFYGQVTLPVQKVIGLINVGAFRPRQLIVMRDGEVFGGMLEGDGIKIQLSSGQTTQIPLAQINRIGYRKGPNEPEEWKFTQPMVMMRSGDRVAVKLPAGPIDVATRYGELKLAPASIAAIAFQNEDNGVHTIYLTDGSHFAGLAIGNDFEMKLADTAGGQVVKFPATAIARMQFVPEMPELDDEAVPTLQLATGDELVGTLEGPLKLDTAFDTLAFDGREIKKLSRSGNSSTDVQVVLWDDTSVSGQLQEQELSCRLNSGAVMKVPVGLVEQYAQPRPRPSAPTVQKIKSLVGDLAATDWKQRDRSAAQLTAMGPTAAAVLREMRDAQPEEVRQRIDQVLKQIGQGPATRPADHAGAPAQPRETGEIEVEPVQEMPMLPAN